MSIPGMRRAAVGLTALAVTALGAVATTPEQAEAGPKPVDVKLLALNDFHGNLEPPSGSSGTIAGQPPAASSTWRPTSPSCAAPPRRRTPSPSPPAT